MSADKKPIKILFFGDIVGKPGRIAVKNFLAKNRGSYDFIIANVENASHGFGLTEKNYNDISDFGVDAMTSGNHIWDKREIFNYIENADKLLRPINYPRGSHGSGSRIFEKNGIKIIPSKRAGAVYLCLAGIAENDIPPALEALKKVL